MTEVSESVQRKGYKNILANFFELSLDFYNGVEERPNTQILCLANNIGQTRGKQQ